MVQKSENFQSLTIEYYSRSNIFEEKSTSWIDRKSQKAKGSAANLGHFAESYASGNAIGREKPSTEFVALSTFIALFIARLIEFSQIALWFPKSFVRENVAQVFLDESPSSLPVLSISISER